MGKILIYRIHFTKNVCFENLNYNFVDFYSYLLFDVIQRLLVNL